MRGNARRLALLGLLALTACGGGPEVGLLTGSEPIASRRGLRDLAQAGPVPVVIEGPEAPASAEVLDALGRGIYGVGTEFALMQAPRGPHLVARFGAPTLDLCGTTPATALPGTVALGYCDTDGLVAGAATEAPAADEAMRLRALAVAARRVFPDDYEPARYRLLPSFGIYGGSRGVSTGVGIGIGF